MDKLRGRDTNISKETDHLPDKRQSSRERSTSRERQVRQDIERVKISASIDRDRIQSLNYKHNISELHLEKTEKDNRDLLHQDYERLTKKVENLPPYDYKAATDNFNKRYRYDIEPLSNSIMVRVWPEGYQELVNQGKARRSELYMNYINLEKEEVDIMDTYRTEDDNIKIEGTYALYTDEMLWQTCRLAAEHKKMNIHEFRPERLRVSSIGEPDTVGKVKPLDIAKDKPITREMQIPYENVMTSKIGKIAFFFFKRFYEEDVAEIVVDKGKKPSRIDQLDFLSDQHK